MKLFFKLVCTYSISFEIYLGIPFWNQGAFLSSASSKILLVDSCWLYMFEDIKGGGVVAELFVLASPELNPEDPFRLLLHPEGMEKIHLFLRKNSWKYRIFMYTPGLTMRSALFMSNCCLRESTFQWPGLRLVLVFKEVLHSALKIK